MNRKSKTTTKVEKEDLVEKLLATAKTGPSLWELDNIVWNERTTDPWVLLEFLKRIQFLRSSSKTENEVIELELLEKLALDLDEEECQTLLSNTEEIAHQTFIENLARQSALEVLCNDQISLETMRTTCKLSPNDFILASKRSPDLINAIRELVIQGETLSGDVAGA
jgi:hypothetical protein